MQIAYLQTRVARRLFVIFLLAAIVPVLLMAIFSYSEVNNQLVELSNRWLRQESKTLGMSLVERMNWRAKALLSIAQSAPADRVKMDTGDYFSTVKEIPLAVGLALTQGQRKHLEHGGVVLRSEGAGRLSMLTQLPGKTGLLQGHMLSKGLWNNEDMDIPYCVIGAAGDVYFCSPTISTLKLHPTKGLSTHSGAFKWHDGKQIFLASYWNADLQGAYADPGFYVVTALPEQEVLQVLQRFRQLFPAVMLLALVVAAWLTLRQLHHQMQPLTKLIDGAHRLAEGDFEVAVDIRDKSEFGALGAAFELMARRLRQKFHMLSALGELDRAILSASGMDEVIQTILQHAPLALTCDCVGIVQLQDKESSASFGYQRVDKPGKFVRHEVKLSQAALEIVASDQPWLALKPGEPGAEFLQSMFDEAMNHALVFLTKTEGHTAAIFVLGFKTLPDELTENVQAGRNFADRLAIAGSNIAWEDKLYRQAHYDDLTGLPSRALLRDHTKQAVSRAQRNNHAVAVMLIDLDRFKEVNDSLGHAVGDALLQAYATKLAGCVRATDTVARLGGDEFVVLLTDLNQGSESQITHAIAAELQQALAQTLILTGQTIKVEASIGIALYPDNADNFDALLKAADAAMYAAKRNQRGHYLFYSEEMNTAAQERFHLTQELHLAFERNEFLLHYQPKVEVKTGKIVGAEALVRWQSPKRGLVPPGKFVDLMDEIGLGTALGVWVLHTACAQLAAWDLMGLPPITVSINISPTQFEQTDIVAAVMNALAQYDLGHHRLELEILEGTAVEASVQTHNKLLGLQERGVQIALDDFGTGYSSLVYLTRIPAKVLKLDQEFIRRLVTDPRQTAIVASIILLAQGLGMQVVAEGVEEQAQLQILKDMDCDLFQGYLFSRPVPAAAFMEMLNKGDELVAFVALTDS